MLTGGVNYLMQYLPDENQKNVYYWYYATQVMHNMNNNDWETWNRKMRNLLVSTQCRDIDKCAIGSWDPNGDEWGTLRRPSNADRAVDVDLGNLLSLSASVQGRSRRRRRRGRGRRRGEAGQQTGKKGGKEK